MPAAADPAEVAPPSSEPAPEPSRSSPPPAPYPTYPSAPPAPSAPPPDYAAPASGYPAPYGQAAAAQPRASRNLRTMIAAGILLVVLLFGVMGHLFSGDWFSSSRISPPAR